MPTASPWGGRHPLHPRHRRKTRPHRRRGRGRRVPGALRAVRVDPLRASRRRDKPLPDRRLQRPPAPGDPLVRLAVRLGIPVASARPAPVRAPSPPPPRRTPTPPESRRHGSRRRPESAGRNWRTGSGTAPCPRTAPARRPHRVDPGHGHPAEGTARDQRPQRRPQRPPAEPPSRGPPVVPAAGARAMRPRLPGGHERGDGPLLGPGVHPVADQGGDEQRLQAGRVTGRPLDGDGYGAPGRGRHADRTLGTLGAFRTLWVHTPAAGPPAVVLPFTHVRFRPCSIVSGLSGLSGSVRRPRGSVPKARRPANRLPPAGSPLRPGTDGYVSSARPVQPPGRPPRPCRPT